jgi:YVTN family beta-propeller protein
VDSYVFISKFKLVDRPYLVKNKPLLLHSLFTTPVWKIFLFFFLVLFGFSSNNAFAGIKPSHAGKLIVKINTPRKSAGKKIKISLHNSSNFTPLAPPNISYSGPQTYAAGTAIGNLSPVNTGGAVNPSPASVATIQTGFNNATGVAFDAAGNIYVAENGTSSIKKIPVGGGTAVTLGTGFSHPAGVAVDAAGNVYVTDNGNSAVKEIPVGGGAIVTLGSGFINPYGIAIDATGNLYIADTGNGAVKEIPAGGGAVVTLATGFNTPTGIAVDAAGNVYVCDRGNNLVKKIPVGGGSVVPIGSGFSTPNGVAVDAVGSVYVADTFNNVIKEIPVGSTNMVTVAGGFNHPTGLAVDPSGNIYIADNLNSAIKLMSPAGGYYLNTNLPAGLSIDNLTGIISGTPTTISPSSSYSVTAYNSAGTSTAIINITVIGGPKPTLSYGNAQNYSMGVQISPLRPTSSGVAIKSYNTPAVTLITGFSHITGIALDAAGNIFTADSTGNTIKRFLPDGSSPETFGSGFNHPTGVAVDVTGNVYIADNGSNTVKKIAAGSNTASVLASGFNSPYGVAVDPTGNLYVSDALNNSVKKIVSGGNTPVTIATGFFFPTGVSADSYGNVYVADYNHYVIKKISATGSVTTIPDLTFKEPNGVAINGSGSVYVADPFGYKMIDIPAPGDTLFSLAHGLTTPSGVAVDGYGNVYVADNSPGAVKKITPTGGYFISPALPLGLTFDITNGKISGTPSFNSPPTDYTVTAYNINGGTSTVINISVGPIPLITAGTVTGIITACQGSSSANPNVQQFIVSGSNLTNNITVTAPSGFEVSLAPDGGYAGNVTITQSGGTVNNTLIYARSSALALPGSISGSVVLSSMGATNVSATVNGTVNASPTVTQPSSQTISTGLATVPVNFTGTANTFSWTNDTPGIGLAASGTGNIPSFNAVNVNGIPVTATITVTPQSVGLAYIVNQGSNTVSVINTALAATTSLQAQGKQLGIRYAKGKWTTATLASDFLNNGSTKATIDGNGHIIMPAPTSTCDINAMNKLRINNPTCLENWIFYVKMKVPVATSTSCGVGVGLSSTNGHVQHSFFFKTQNESGPSGGGYLYLYTQNSGVWGLQQTTARKLAIKDTDYIAMRVERTKNVIKCTTWNLTTNGTPLDTTFTYLYASALPYMANTGDFTLFGMGGQTEIDSISVTSSDVKNADLMALGDSKTQGAITSDPTKSWAYLLGKNYVNYAINAGGGDDCNSILARINGELKDLAPKQVLLDIGTNDVNEGHSFSTIMTQIRSIVSTLTGYGAKVYVHTEYQTYANLQPLRDSLYNAYNPTGQYIDTWAATMAAGALNADGIHPTDLGQSLIYKMLLQSALFTQPPTLYNASNAMVGTPVSTGAGPIGVSVSPNGRVIYVANQNSNNISVINTGADTVATTIPVGTGPAGVSVSPNGSLVYVANESSNTVSVINALTNKAFSTITVGLMPFGVSVSPDGGRVYVTNSTSNTVSVINTETNTVIVTIPVGSSPHGIAVSPDGSRVYVANENSNTVSVLNTLTYTVVATITVGSAPFGISVSSNGSNVYVANQFSGTVSVINTANNAVTASLPVGNGSTGISVSPDGGMAYVTNQDDGTVSVINTSTNSVSATIGGFSGPASFGNFISPGMGCSGTPATFTITVNPSAFPAISSITTASTTPTNAATVNYTVTFDTAITGLTVANFSLTTTGVTSASVASVTGSGTTYTVTVNTGSGDGTIVLNLANSTGVLPGIGSALPFTGQSYSIDKTAPVITIGAPSSNSTNSGPITYTITYADPNFNSATLTAANIFLNTTGNATGTVAVTGSGTLYTVMISGISGIGTIGISVGAGTATDLLGNIAAAKGPSAIFSVAPPVSTDASLSAISVSTTTLSPSFSASTTSYTVNVPMSTTSFVVTPNSTNSKAQIKVNSTIVASGTASPAIPLNIGSNTINVQVTAEDGVTTSQYVITVIRSKSSDALLSNLSLNQGTISPAFASSVFNYTATVPYSASYIYVDPVEHDPARTATIKVNGNTVASNAQSSAIPLNVGNNTITTIVTAQDGVTTQTYTLTITRTVASSNANLGAIYPDSQTLTPGFAPGISSYTIFVANNVTAVGIVNILPADANATITLNGFPYIFGWIPGTGLGDPDATFPASNVGSNISTILVKAEDGITTKTYTVNIIRSLPSNADLSNLAISSGTLSPVFASGTTGYSASVGNTVSSITITPTISDANATVKVNGSIVVNGSASASIPLAVGSNAITVAVTAQDGTTIKTYTITVTRAASAIADLAALTINTGTLSPVFAAGTTNYTATVNNSVTSVIVTPSSADANATIKVNGLAVVSGNASVSISLVVGSNAITVAVTAQDGTIKTTTITVTRAASSNADLSNLIINNYTLSPAFAAGTTSYSASVGNAVSSITITSTTSDANATIKVNGVVTVSGTVSSSIPLTVGSNTINVAVTAQDGTTIKTYIITVTRAASSNTDLSNLVVSNSILFPVFTASRTLYSAPVANTVSSVTVTPTVSDANATVTVNGVAVASGSASASIPVVPITNVITIVVTAQDGTINTTTIVVTRPNSANADLSSLAISSGTLSPVFAAGTTNYSVLVDNSVTSITLLPTLSDPNATIQARGISLPNGSTSVPLSLAIGSNTILISVIAQDGTTIKTYTLTVSRASASANADLSGISISNGTLNPAFAPSITSYTSSVNNTVTSVSLSPTLNDLTATVKVNGVAVTSGTASPGLSLNVGNNAITTIVTAQDGTIKTYTVTVTRAGAANADLASLTINSGTLSPVFATDTTGYSVSVGNSVTSIFISPTVSDVNATVKINGSIVASGSVSAIPLLIGTNTINFTVTAQDGTTTKTYTITATRAASSSADLAALTISNGTLSPVFAAGTTSYTATVDNSITSVTVIPTCADVNATIKINGVVMSSGAVSPIVFLNVGNSTLNIAVTAPDGTVKTYTLVVTRLPSSNANLGTLILDNATLTPGFAPGITNYNVTVASSVSVFGFIQILPADNTATMKVNGATLSPGPYPFLPLNTGSNVYNFVVTAQDGVTIRTYTVNVIRAAPGNADLSNLTISNGTLSPAFSAGTTGYSASVGNVSSIIISPRVSDTSSTVKVNGSTVVSGSTSSSIPLTFGSNTITVTVTAQDGTIKTYTITVTRAASSNADLSNLTINNGTLTPGFSAGIINYTVAVANSISSVIVISTLSDANATAVTNGSGLLLNTGSNIITITITAQDGVTIKTYTITVTRAVFTLPVTNFKLTITSAACKGSSNGSIDISAVQALNYTATITGNGLNTAYPFTSAQNIPNLAAGTYSICITVAGQSSYQECYSVVVTEPKDLSVYSTVNITGANSITLALSGAGQYTINLNGTIYTTTSSSVTLPLKIGSNNLVVTTDKLCQGSVEKVINILGNIVPYPDPFTSTLNLNLGDTNISNVTVDIHNVPEGIQVYSKQFVNQSGVLQLDLSGLKSGVYSLHLVMDGTERILKIQKK